MMSQPLHIGRNLYLCKPCNELGTDPMKTRGTPHCHSCNKHHGLHVDCKGNSLVPAPIDYMQLFYSTPKRDDVAVTGLIA